MEPEHQITFGPFRLERFAIAYLVHLEHHPKHETLLSRPP